MNPIRTPQSSVQSIFAPGSESSTTSLHAAVTLRDDKAIARLRNEGVRANTLDADGRSPLDVLENMRDIDERSRSGLYVALLQSLNPTAPLGYTKPEALHGTPWGLEILQSGALKGGVNDAKGGTQSLEGKVFFSDRTPESTADQATRPDLRSKPRVYAAGKGLHPSNAHSRAIQHRMAQVILHALNNGQTLPATTAAPLIEVANQKQPQIEGAAWLQRLLHVSYINTGGGRKFIGTPLDEHLNSLKLPGSVALKSSGQINELRGEDLNRFYHQAASELQRSLEAGKAPYLGLLNQGGIVPLVFGFEKINDLSTHRIQYSSKIKQYSYQDTEHPLSGHPEKGGKLKELEVRSLSDFATLCLGCAIKEVALPADLVVRIKGQNGEKAHYLDEQKIRAFRQKLLAEIAEQAGNDQLQTLSLHRLQDINSSIRASFLSASVKQTLQG
ncbi:ankyrin repeat domain-containing protein [Pseudomonas sp. B21-054]|uniref:ankyrin repeat domain-containing protein n=1 Tax=Pseudomonas sp. B21-054 TaxID=2895494 RepID=UPI00222E7CE6|nr:ankyrin repeat domain-containing protein [Pseudomonas sp. B21-054]UZE15861.1 ankyrin repeat domain-containing protein [Pseudomonas sp. B21-054]